MYEQYMEAKDVKYIRYKYITENCQHPQKIEKFIQYIVKCNDIRDLAEYLHIFILLFSNNFFGFNWFVRKLKPRCFSFMTSTTGSLCRSRFLFCCFLNQYPIS